MQPNYAPRPVGFFGNQISGTYTPSGNYSQLGSDFGGGNAVGTPVTQPPVSQPLPTLDAEPAGGLTFTDLNPLMQRQQLAAQALQEGSSTAPAAGLGGGLARLAQAVVGGMNLGRANRQINEAKQHNAAVMMDAMRSGDWSKLATADNDQANKLGDMMLQAQLKYMPTERLMTPDELKQANLPEGTVGTISRTGERKILYRPNAGLPKGYRYNAEGTGIEFIPGGPADPAIIAKDTSTRHAANAKPAAPDQSNLPPWQRKWQ